MIGLWDLAILLKNEGWLIFYRYCKYIVMGKHFVQVEWFQKIYKHDSCYPYTHSTLIKRATCLVVLHYLFIIIILFFWKYGKCKCNLDIVAVTYRLNRFYRLLPREEIWFCFVVGVITCKILTYWYNCYLLSRNSCKIFSESL